MLKVLLNWDDKGVSGVLSNQHKEHLRGETSGWAGVWKVSAGRLVGAVEPIQALSMLAGEPATRRDPV